MEAKDTVMSEEEINKVFITSEVEDLSGIGLYGCSKQTILYNPKAVAEKQAEVSFKAGYEKGIIVANGNHNENMAQQYKAGMQKVVEWIQEHSNMFIAGRDIEKMGASNNKEATSHYPIIKYLDWQAQLKAWGLLEPPSQPLQ
jgi:hypothetical protein